MNTALATILLSLPLALAACGGGATTTGTGGSAGHSSTTDHAGGAGGSGGTGPTLTEVCAAAATARCARLEACTGGVGITVRFGDAATCAARFALSCVASLSAADTGATPASVAACTAALPGESCTQYLDNDPVAACQSQPGPGAAGAVCAFNAQCASAFCLVEKGAACGACAASPAVGAPCASGAECGPNQACPKATSVCAAYAPQGGACGTGAPCAAGFSCVGETATAMGSCQPAGTMVGTACDPKHKTAPGCESQQGFYCDATTLTCAVVAYAAADQPCGIVNGAVVTCKAGGLCVYPAPMATAGTCEAAAADGAACDDTLGPPCLGPARCVRTSDGGTAGVCTLLSADACH
jgi:hypothetical protein